MTTAAPAPQPSPGPAPAPRSTRGAKILTFAGAAVLLVALAAVVVAVVLFLRAVPTGIVTADGGPGSAALASGPVGGSAELEVAEPGRYTVWQVSGDEDEFLAADDVAVTPGGDVTVSSPAVSQSFGRGGAEAIAVADLVVTTPGDYVVTVLTPDAPAGSTFVVTEGTGFREFFTGLGGTIAAWFVAIGGGIVGVMMLTGGIVWWALARRPAQP
ncbi:hypothetical protein [Antribacter gilvus]|uniref:hypothetical protein n=1 Tax=Antribacter gilvus TaxID=2304675 RepID=UPI000F7A4DD2|nr:hypothetical protein [Antribacter gilvus]